MDSPNTALSSSPAAPSTTGGHLADAVKSFGSIDADGNSDPDVVKTRRTSSLSNPIGPVQEKKLSVHSLFTSKAPAQVPLGSSPSRPAMSPPQLHQQPIPHIRRQSMGQGGPGFQGQMPVGSPSFTSGPPMRPPIVMPNQPRSPVANPNIPHGQYSPMPPLHVQQGFRPPQQGMGAQQPPVRPNGMGTQGMPRPMMGPGQYGMHPGPQAPQYPVMGYPPQGGFYVSYHSRTYAIVWD